MEIQTRAAVPEDVIAHAWYSLGYRPTASLVFVPADGPIRRSGLVLRANLPPPGLPREVIHQLAQRVADRLQRYGSRSTDLLVASERVLLAPPVRLVRALRTVLRCRGIALREVVGVTRRGFRSLSCRDRGCCPHSGHSLAAVTTSPVAIMHAMAGDTLAEDRPPEHGTSAPAPPSVASARDPDDVDRGEAPHEGDEPDLDPDDLDPDDRDAADLDPDDLDADDLDADDVDLDEFDPDDDFDENDDRNAIASALAGAEALAATLLAGRDADPDRAQAAEPPPQLGGRSQLTASARDDWWRVWTKALATGELRPEHRTGLAVAMSDPGLRNGVLATAMGAPPDTRGPTVVPGWRRAMETPPDDLDLVTRAACILALALLQAPPDQRADGLAVLAVLTWYADNPVAARRLAVEALKKRRGHGLASTLLALVLSGTPPPWARSALRVGRPVQTSQGGDLPHGPPGC